MDAKQKTQKMQCFASSLLKGYQLKAENIIFIIQNVIEEIFLKEPNVLTINTPSYVVGEINGNLEDCLSVFDIGGPLPYSTYLFLGNFTGSKGSSLNTILLLFIYKYLYKENIFLIQGSNEKKLKLKKVGKSERSLIPVVSKNKELMLNQEIMHLYELRDAEEIWKSFISVFNVIPICAIVGNLYFCTDCNFMLPDSQNLSIELIRRIDRTTYSDGSVLLIHKDVAFLKENKFGFLITGLDKYKSTNPTNTNHFEIFSSPHSVGLNKYCYVFEINEHKVLRKIRMKPCQTEFNNIYSFDTSSLFF